MHTTHSAGTLYRFADNAKQGVPEGTRFVFFVKDRP